MAWKLTKWKLTPKKRFYYKYWTIFTTFNFWESTSIRNQIFFLQTPSNNLLQSTWSFNQGYLNLLHSKRLDYFRCLRYNNFGLGIIVVKLRKIFFSLDSFFFFFCDLASLSWHSSFGTRYGALFISSSTLNAKNWLIN